MGDSNSKESTAEKAKNATKKTTRTVNDFVKGNQAYHAVQGHNYKILYPKAGANVGKIEFEF